MLTYKSFQYSCGVPVCGRDTTTKDSACHVPASRPHSPCYSPGTPGTSGWKPTRHRHGDHPYRPLTRVVGFDVAPCRDIVVCDDGSSINSDTLPVPERSEESSSSSQAKKGEAVVLGLLDEIGVSHSCGDEADEDEASIHAQLVLLARTIAELDSALFDPYGDVIRKIDLAETALREIVPIADKLGVWCYKSRIEDSAFRLLHPRAFHDVTVHSETRRNRENMGTVVREVGEALRVAGNVAVQDISGRPKSAYGIWCKTGNKNTVTHDDVDRVLDVSAVRVVVHTKDDCYQAMRDIQLAFPVLPGRFKDRIRRIRENNGYRGLHDTVSVRGTTTEVQVRTYKMHYVAEYGSAAHWAYKRLHKDEYTRSMEDIAETARLRLRAVYGMGVRDVDKIRATNDADDYSLYPLGWSRDIRFRQEMKRRTFHGVKTTRRLYVSW